MNLKPILAVALLLSLTSSARSEESLDGVWLPTSAELGGKKFPDEVRKTIRLELKGKQYTAIVGTVRDDGTCKFDPSAEPKTLDITGTAGPNKGKTILAIYEREGDTLRVCYDLAGKRRPAEFKSDGSPLLFLVEYKLQKP
jgi:uncharacterized protein (TIGR03067 family)